MDEEGEGTIADRAGLGKAEGGLRNERWLEKTLRVRSAPWGGVGGGTKRRRARAKRDFMLARLYKAYAK
jgi:hypothetical protein